MDVDALEEGGDVWDDELGDGEGGTMGMVYPTTIFLPRIRAHGEGMPEERKR